MLPRAFWNSFLQQIVIFTLFVHALFIGGVLCAFPGSDLLHSRLSTPPASSAQDDGLKPHHTIGLGALRLRHVYHHGAGQPGPRARRLDITSERLVAQAAAAAHFGPFAIKASLVKIDKPAIRRHELQVPMSPLWLSEDVPGPDVGDKQTVLNFANMSEDAYHPDRSDPAWLNIGEEYNSTLPFGWEDQGIRGHVFSDDTNTTVILSVKGTSIAVFEGNGTSGNDKDNDNLFGSCCCGQGGSYLWRQVRYTASVRQRP